MRVLIDIGHPAHVHLFKHFAWEMQKKGHNIFFTCREKEFEIELLTKYGFQYKSFGRKYSSKLGKLWGLIEFDVKELITGLRFKPDILLSHGSFYAAHAAFLLRKPHISLEDTFNMEQVRLYLPFTDVVLTGNYPHIFLGKKEIQYPGYHELAYLHPNRFKANEEVLEILGLENEDKYAIVRFVGWKASHDVGHTGISFKNKVRSVNELSKYLKVFITSEDKLSNELSEYQIRINPDQMHDVLCYAHLFFGESATMASESAVLGTPAVYLDNTGRYYTAELEKKYGMVFNFTESENDQEQAINKALELAQQESLKQEYLKKRISMLEDKIDVTSFVVWFVENYPESEKEMKKGDFSFERFKLISDQ